MSIQVAILSALTDSIRQGHYTDTLGIPTSIVLVGHSFGSYVSSALAAIESSIADAIVLTGYSLSGGDARVVLEGFAPRVANLQGTDVFCDFDSGYLTTVDIFASINNFYKAPLYEHDVAEFAERPNSPLPLQKPLPYRLLPRTSRRVTSQAQRW